MPSCREFVRSAAATVVIGAALCLGAPGPASAAWVFIGDPDTSDTAFNGQGGLNQATGGPNQEIPPWLKDLLNLSSTPTISSFANDPSVINGLTAGLLTIHDGQGPLKNPQPIAPLYGNGVYGAGNLTWAFACSTGCGTFTVGDYFGKTTVSNYRLYAGVVPIPAAAWLFGSALVGLGWMRRRRDVTPLVA